MYISDHNIRSNSETMAGCAAFTLIEIIVVVVILAIAALIAIPVFTGAADMQLSAAADKLAADMEYAKSLAVTTQRKHKVVFDINADSYEIWDADTNAIVKDPVKKGDFNFSVVYAQEGRLNRVGVSTVDFNGTAVVQFNYTGAPLDGLDFPLTDPDHSSVTLEAGGNQMTVRVEPATGYISIQ
jgi:prepilin-type N-terminal cleavage/methylation domain-containing protein